MGKLLVVRVLSTGLVPPFGLTLKMTDLRKPSPQSGILHICSPSLARSDEALAVEKWIADAGLEPVRCGDMYMGLAKAMGNPSCQFLAVIVCVEDCSPSDFEFFSILARSRRDLPVYIYGSRSPDRVVRALESGARGLASREAVLALRSKLTWRADSLDPEPEPTAVPSSFASPQGDFRGSPPEPSQSLERDACAPGEEAASTLSRSDGSLGKEDEGANKDPGEIEGEDEVEDDAIEEESSGARVPWLRYSGGPDRKRPASANENRSAARPESPAPIAHATNGSTKTPRPACDKTYEPLLTEQELAALLGDDLDDTGMQEREMLTGEGEVPGSGTR